MKNYNEPGHDGVTKTWNMMQNDFKCCGVTSYQNWKNDSEFGKSGDVPADCCINPEEGCGNGVGNESESVAAQKIHTKGCFTKLEDVIEGNEAGAIGVGVGVVVLLLIGVIIACCVGRHIGESSNYV